MRDMNIKDINQKINGLKVEIANLSLKIANSDVKAIKEKREKKKEVARLSTISTEKMILAELNKEDKDA
ncbi:MAG: 50S ribosomal protein L29 [bacterium]|nr:50S ribosomal protein L29 [bacterium]